MATVCGTDHLGDLLRLDVLEPEVGLAVVVELHAEERAHALEPSENYGFSRLC